MWGGQGLIDPVPSASYSRLLTGEREGRWELATMFTPPWSRGQSAGEGERTAAFRDQWPVLRQKILLCACGKDSALLAALEANLKTPGFSFDKFKELFDQSRDRRILPGELSALYVTPASNPLN